MVIAALLLVAIASCRDTSKSAEQSTQVAQSEAVTQQAAKDLLPAAPSSPILDMASLLSEKDVKEITEKMTSGEIRVHITPKCGNDLTMPQRLATSGVWVIKRPTTASLSL